MLVQKKTKKKLNNRGMTLVEMIVSFALISIFMVAATMVLSFTMNVYYDVKGTQMGYQVSDILLTKIAGQIEGAQNVNISSREYMDASGKPLIGNVIVASDAVELRNSQGSQIKLCVDGTGNKAYLALHYYEVTEYDEDTDTEQQLYKAVDWEYDDAMYMGYYVTDLKFEPAGAEYPNTLRAKLTLHNPKYGDYTAQKLIKCYNLDEGSKVIQVP